MTGTLTAANLADLFLHLLLLSLLSIGGAVSTAPEMHRYLVGERGWLNDTEFTASVALAQAAPGPNVLFVPVLGYQIAGLAGAALAIVGILLPSTVLSLSASRWGRARRDTPGVRAFTGGLAPVTIGLLLATAWVLARPFLAEPTQRYGALALMALTVVAMLKTRLAPIWLILAGGMAGAAGLV
ncbi:chromate transporter [Pseudothauera rhizosphaerae]|uniref:Chromate transporter n=1 Tax=Pseudothauera rhizosphaerae TaxID=2565932 RepID=A0A4S4AMU6_9RHOO|nr:chromate transporter [Pseudothauera rhizosphaerae]THF60952.1 chromate transporter [Pseudothauera rhizosphaerae]